MKKLIPLILLTVLVGCTDSNKSSKSSEAEKIYNQLEIMDKYSEDFNSAFSGNIDTDELVLCIGEVFKNVLGCANYLLAFGEFEITATDNSDSTVVIFFTRKAEKSN